MKAVSAGSMKMIIGLSVSLLCSVPGISFSAVDEIHGGPYDSFGTNAPGNGDAVSKGSETRNEMLLRQRMDSRTLDTEQGIVLIPAGVEIVDRRPVDEWYEKKDAKVTFVFAKDKMIRVEIRN